MKKYLIDEVRLEEILRLELELGLHTVRSMEATREDLKEYHDEQWNIKYEKKQDILKECEL